MSKVYNYNLVKKIEYVSGLPCWNLHTQNMLLSYFCILVSFGSSPSPPQLKISDKALC